VQQFLHAALLQRLRCALQTKLIVSGIPGNVTVQLRGNLVQQFGEVLAVVGRQSGVGHIVGRGVRLGVHQVLLGLDRILDEDERLAQVAYGVVYFAHDCFDGLLAGGDWYFVAGAQRAQDFVDQVVAEVAVVLAGAEEAALYHLHDDYR